MNIEQLKLPQQEKIDLFLKEYLAVPEFVLLRTFVEENAFGFGEKQFYPMHKLLVDSIDGDISFLEIGVFRGQILALYGLLRTLCDKNIDIIGITPLDSTDGHWESDYEFDIKHIHEKFNLPQPKIIKGLSTDPNVVKEASELSVDILYIDGGHTSEVVESDIINYTPILKKNGFLIIDDSANNIPETINGYFWGIQEVSDTVDKLLDNNKDFEYLGNIIHNRLWIKK